MTTATFIDKLLKKEIDLNEHVNISANELFSLMTENLDIAKESTKRLAENTIEINNLKKKVAELELKNKRLQYDLIKKEGALELSMQQEKIQRNRANALEQKFNKTVTYKKGDLYNGLV